MRKAFGNMIGSRCRRILRLSVNVYCLGKEGQKASKEPAMNRIVFLIKLSWGGLSVLVEHWILY